MGNFISPFSYRFAFFVTGPFSLKTKLDNLCWAFRLCLTSQVATKLIFWEDKVKLTLGHLNFNFQLVAAPHFVLSPKLKELKLKKRLEKGKMAKGNNSTSSGCVGASIIIKLKRLGVLHKLCALALFAQQFVTPGQEKGRAWAKDPLTHNTTGRHKVDDGKHRANELTYCAHKQFLVSRDRVVDKCLRLSS